MNGSDPSTVHTREMALVSRRAVESSVPPELVSSRRPRHERNEVGPMQFEVAAHRMAAEFGSPIRLEPLPYQVVRRLADPSQRSIVDSGRRSEVLTRLDGTDLALFADELAMRVMLRGNPELALESLVAEGG